MNINNFGIQYDRPDPLDPLNQPSEPETHAVNDVQENIESLTGLVCSKSADGYVVDCTEAPGSVFYELLNELHEVQLLYSPGGRVLALINP